MFQITIGKDILPCKQAPLRQSKLCLKEHTAHFLLLYNPVISGMTGPFAGSGAAMGKSRCHNRTYHRKDRK
jgi:hypothetical protein